MSLKDELLAEAIARRERLDHPPGGHTSTELDIITEPAARALAIARLEAEAEDAQREAAQRLAALLEDRRREAVMRAKERVRAKAELEQRTEPRLVPPPPKLRDIARAVAEHYGVTVVELVGSGRKTRVTRPRQVFCYLARKLTFKSFPDLGRALGGRDHTTTLWAFNKISVLIATDAQLAADVAAIRRTLEGA